MICTPSERVTSILWVPISADTVGYRVNLGVGDEEKDMKLGSVPCGSSIADIKTVSKSASTVEGK